MAENTQDTKDSAFSLFYMLSYILKTIKFISHHPIVNYAQPTYYFFLLYNLNTKIYIYYVVTNKYTIHDLPPTTIGMFHR